VTHGSLFSGIGGFDLAAEWMGWENAFHCELNPFGQKILHHYWPDAIQYSDITETDFSIHEGRIDILSGGFPCQPYSLAGKRLGKEDDRHLWPEMLRAIREIQPTWVVGENVFGLVNWNGGLVFHEVQTDLEAEGYEVQPYVLPASAVNASHRRDRVWFVAYSTMQRLERATGKSIQKRINGFAGYSADASNSCIQGLQGRKVNGSIGERKSNSKQQSSRFFQSKWEVFPTQSPICGGDDGLPSQLDGITFSKWRNESIKAYGNAIVPQVVYQIFKAIQFFNQ
jgi:DNA (cytosine-5)-methyltransferase 1